MTGGRTQRMIRQFTVNLPFAFPKYRSWIKGNRREEHCDPAYPWTLARKEKRARASCRSFVRCNDMWLARNFKPKIRDKEIKD